MSGLRLCGIGRACLWVGLSACSRTDPPLGAGEPTSGEPPGHGAAHELATPTAFDLAAAPSGAVLAWVPSGGGELQTARFDAQGLPGTVQDGSGGARGPAEPRPAAGAQGLAAGATAADLALVASAESLALAWSEADGQRGALRAAWVSADGTMRKFELDPIWRDAAASRGALALASRETGALLLARGDPVPCADPGEEACHAFWFYRVSEEGARASGIPLNVPRPCAGVSAQLVSAAPRPGAKGGLDAEASERLDYAICSSARAETALTIFSIEPRVAYAAAEEALAGCTPLGAGRFGGEAVFVATCSRGRRAATIPASGGAARERNLDERGLVCKAGAALLRFGGDWLRLIEPLDRLELLASEDLAPPGARAVWTGEALLVARAEGQRLVLSRYACRGSSLVELEGPFSAGI